MTDDTSKEMEPEEVEEAVSPEPEMPPPPRRGAGWWIVLTIIFALGCAALAWLYLQQQSELRALRDEADLANRQTMQLRQQNRKISNDLSAVVDKLRGVVVAVDELRGTDESLEAPLEEPPPEGPEGPPAEPGEADQVPEALPSVPEPERPAASPVR